jgi:hypothetical protein
VLAEIFRPDHTSNSLGELSVNIIPQFVQKENSVTVMAGTHQDYAADYAI